MKKCLFIVLASVLAFQAIALDRTQIRDKAEDVTPLLNGMNVPNVTVKTADGAPFSLQAMLMQKPAVIVFYRGGWCPYCSRQLAELKEIEADLVKEGYQIIAISPESVSKLQSQKLKTEFAAQLVSDENLAAIRAFGVGFYVPDETREKYKQYDITLAEDKSERAVLPAPAIFITNTDSQIAFSYVNPDFRVRPSAELVLSAAKLVKKVNPE